MSSCSARASRRAALGLLLLVLGYASLATLYSVNQHHSLRTKIMDLGVYDNVFWQSAHGNPLGCSFLPSGTHISAHFDPVLVLLSPIYLLFPRTELLLGLQSVWLASTAIPVFLLARRKLAAPWQALALAAAALLHPGLHGANFYEFHSLSLVAPLLVWAVYFLEAGAWRRLVPVLVLMLLVREDVAILTALIGVSMILGRRAVKLGIATLAVSVLFLAALNVWVLPAGGSGYSYAHYLGGLGVDSVDKLFYLVQMFLPLLFLPLLAPRGRIILLYGLGFVLLASKPAVYSMHFQYTSLLYPAALALVPLALARIRERQPRFVSALVVGVLVASIVVSAVYGGLVPNGSFRAGFSPLNRVLDATERATYGRVAQAVERIPGEASVAASIHMGPHISSRRVALEFPYGWGTDFIFVDRAEVDGWSAANLLRLQRSGAYEVVDPREQRFVLFRRVGGVPLPPRLANRPTFSLDDL